MADLPTLDFTDAVGSIAVYTAPGPGTEVTVVSLNKNQTIDDEIKIDYGLSVEMVATANWNVVFEIRLYRDSTLVHTRTANRNGSQAGTQRFPIGDTYVDEAPATASVTYSLRVIVTTETNIDSASAVNRDLNTITFRP